MLFQLDPSATDHVRGGKEREVRSRGGREAFVANERAGRGMVLAVRSDQSFRYDPTCAYSVIRAEARGQWPKTELCVRLCEFSRLRSFSCASPLSSSRSSA